MVGKSLDSSNSVQAYEMLEAEFASLLDVPVQSVVVCSSGTAALHLAFESMPISKQTYVAVPDYTMIACARAVTMANLKPLFIRCNHYTHDSQPLLMNLDTLREAIKDKVLSTTYYDLNQTISAVLAVHTYGRQVPMAKVHKLDSANDLFIIEDMAELHGVKPHPYTNAACWSFYKNKIIHGEEGGAVWFKDENHAKLARMLRCQGFTESHDFWHVPRGHNYRLANCLAEQILTSLKTLYHEVRIRREAEDLYDHFIPKMWQIYAPRESPWVYDLAIPGLKPGLDQSGQALLVKRLNEAGIAARQGFKPLHQQQEYASTSQPYVWPGNGEPEGVMPYEVIYLPLVGVTASTLAKIETVCQGMGLWPC